MQDFLECIDGFSDDFKKIIEQRNEEQPQERASLNLFK